MTPQKSCGAAWRNGSYGILNLLIVPPICAESWCGPCHEKTTALASTTGLSFIGKQRNGRCTIDANPSFDPVK
jgi:hypothetical protein